MQRRVMRLLEVYKMLWQLHHQFKDGHTEFKSQREKTADVSDDEIHKWIRETTAAYPLPEGAQWVMGNEDWEHFMWQGSVS